MVPSSALSFGILTAPVAKNLRSFCPYSPNPSALYSLFYMLSTRARVLLLMAMALALGGCGAVNTRLSSVIADHVPLWAGGPPPGVPPGQAPSSTKSVLKKYRPNRSNQHHSTTNPLNLPDLTRPDFRFRLRALCAGGECETEMRGKAAPLVDINQRSIAYLVVGEQRLAR